MLTLISLRTRRCAWALSLALLAPSAEARAQIARPLLIAGGLSQPVFLTAPPGDASRLFIVERIGRVRIYDWTTNTLLAQPFLTVPDADTTSEGGLLGLAFHPDYASNGRFFIYATVPDAAPGPFSSYVREYTVSQDDPNVANPEPTTIITWPQPFANHNAGWIGFGPSDGLLSIMSGDGGSGGDPDDNAQTITDNLLGKVLRIDVDSDDFPADSSRNYAIPPDNPFVGAAGDDEIWALGLRNPWRASFDRETGDLWIGDVGQGVREEINFQPASSQGGENYGWNRREGTTDFLGGPPLPDEVAPVFDYPRFGDAAVTGRSVTGSYIYRGSAAGLRGRYVFADFFTGLFVFDPADPRGTAQPMADLLAGPTTQFTNVASFGEDARGELHILEFSAGRVWLITCPWDLNADMTTGPVDLLAMLVMWGQPFGPNDLLALLASWGSCR